MAHKVEKKIVAVYLNPDMHSDYLKACENEGRSMAKQGEILLRKFILNSKRKASQ